MHPDVTISIETPISELPSGAVFNNYQEYFVQDLIIKPKVTKYMLARYKLPDGTYITAPLPKNVKGHFGSGVKQFILHQYNTCNTTQQKISQTLTDIGLQISEGQVNNLLLNGTVEFEKEYDDILQAGLSTAGETSLESDDSSHRHQGKNGSMFVIRNSFFTYFKSTNSKSRASWLEALRGKHTDFVINDIALSYFKSYNPKHDLWLKIEKNNGLIYANEDEWAKFLSNHNINSMTMAKQLLKALREAVLLGSVIDHGLDPNAHTVSDGATTYKILHQHGICWIHAERLLKNVVSPSSDAAAKEKEKLLNDLWDYYRKLKLYQSNPLPEMKEPLRKEFDTVFEKKVRNNTLRDVLYAFRQKKEDLLKVLDHPMMPLHNNGSERDIRARVIRRKISGGTRTDKGKLARDIGSSIVGTCRKLNISARNFFGDRINKLDQIQPLPNLIRQKLSSRPSCFFINGP